MIVDGLLLKILMAVAGAITTFLLGLIAWGIKSLVLAILNNTKELAILNSKIETLFKSTEDIPKLKNDVQNLHSWRREVQDKLGD